MDTNPRLAKFISSQQMESSEMQERIINLGKALVQELGLDPGVDTLSRWMAHYVAEQIVTAESTEGAEKDKAEQRCFETILKLWQRRSSFPRGRRPLENFDSIMNVLDRLDPENTRPFYLAIADDDLSKETSGLKPNDVQEWLNVALEIDSAARALISFAINQAAQYATDEKTATWLDSGIKMMNDGDLSIVIRLLGMDKEVQGGIAQERLRREQEESLRSKIEKLDGFMEISSKVRTILTGTIESIRMECPKSDKTIDTL